LSYHIDSMEGLLEIENALMHDRVHYQEVANLIFDKAQKPWHTKEWKSLRDNLIKDHCEQCSTNEGIMVLQHFWHPDSYSSIQQKITHQYYERYFQQFTIELQENMYIATEEYIEKVREYRDLCSQCKSINFKARKTKLPTYRCNYCQHEFDNPVYSEYFGGPTKDELKKKISDQFIRNEIWKHFEQHIRKEAILESLRQHRRYVSCEDTKTFCKKCAFMWDSEGTKLCDKCKTHFHKRYREVCKHCSTR
jgi:translation elongation factor EF-G